MSIHYEIGEIQHDYPLNNPRIGWRRITGAVTASSAAAGYAAANANTVRTDSFWRPTTTTGWWAIEEDAPSAVDYCGIAAHDLGTQNALLVIEYYNGTAWVQAGPEIEPEDDGAIFILFTAGEREAWRVRVTSADAPPTIGVIQFGSVLELPRPAVFAPSTSFERTRQLTYAVNITAGGHFAGRSIERVSLAPKMTVNYLSEEWIAAEWDAFVAHAELNPFFIADRPESYPKSVSYAWTLAQLSVGRVTPNSRISCNIELELMGFLA